MGILKSRRWKSKPDRAPVKLFPRAFEPVRQYIKKIVNGIRNAIAIADDKAYWAEVSWDHACHHYGEPITKFDRAKVRWLEFWKSIYTQSKEALGIFEPWQLKRCHNCGFTRRAHTHRDFEFDIDHWPCDDFVDMDWPDSNQHCAQPEHISRSCD